MPNGLAYRGDLDGLRAVAVVPVVLLHLGFPYVPGGFVGVDVFFVLSGFFITRLIVYEMSAGRFSLLGFYDRRIRRLFPALFAMLLCSAIAAIIVLPPSGLAQFGYTLAAAALSISNFAFWMESGYFALDAETMPLLHTWSLAVEEQFYIVFPAFLMLLWRYARNRIAFAIALVAAVSFAASVWGTTNYPEATFYLLPTRVWELACGSILALSVIGAPSAPWMRNAAAAGGLSAILAAIFTYSADMPFPGLAALLPCLGCALVIWAGQESAPCDAAESGAPSFAARALAVGPISFIGLISYSLYIWHWPIIVFARYATIEPFDLSGKAALGSAIFLISCLSWSLIEQPMRSGARVWPHRMQRFAYSGAAVTFIVLIGAFAHFKKASPEVARENALELSQQANQSSPDRRRCHADGRGNTAFAETCVAGRSDAKPVVVFADSHGVELGYALAEKAEGNGLRVRQITSSSCPPALDFNTPGRPACGKHVEIMMHALLASPKAMVILMSHYLRWDRPDGRDVFWAGLGRVAESLSRAGHDVIILGGVPPHPYGSVPLALAKWVKLGREPTSYSFPFDHVAADLVDQRLRAIAERSGATYTPLLEYACQGSDRCRAYAHQHSIYFDGNHLSIPVARRVVDDLILPALTHRGSALAECRETSEGRGRALCARSEERSAKSAQPGTVQ